MPYEGHTMEHFSVCGLPFAYSDYMVTAVFNHTSSHGGPIRAGAPGVLDLASIKRACPKPRTPGAAGRPTQSTAASSG